MKKIFFITFLLLVAMVGFSQEELHIHHINVEDGDATFIGIYDSATHRYTASMLIDGGASAPGALLLPYLKKIMNSDQPRLNIIALTHYHKDHYNGLLALKNGRLRADSVIDPGGYVLGSVFPAQAGVTTTETKPDAMAVYDGWTDALKTAVAAGFLKGHITGIYHYGTTRTSDLGHRLVLGTMGGQQVSLECIAGWGNNLDAGPVHADESPEKDNANNFSLAFILSCGQFRYFIGGDLGGSTDAQYIDQESSLTAYLAKEYPTSWSWNHSKQSAGHICGFKADHHGSNHSNNAFFMSAMTPAITVTSAGSQASWHLPHPAYLTRLAQVKPISVWTASSNQVYNRGIYITNLYNFNGYPSKTTATGLFGGQAGVSFSYGNAQQGVKSSYLIKVNAEGIAGRSQFQVYRTDGSGASSTLLANFLCHTL
jgi:hypothetical protein